MANRLGIRDYTPPVWRRHATNRTILTRSSDVTDHIQRVMFQSVEQVDRYLIRQKIARKDVDVEVEW